MNPNPEGEDSGNATELNLLLVGDIQEIDSMARTLRLFLVSHRCSESIIAECLLAVIEACTNAIRHAPKEAKTSPVTMDARLVGKEIEFTIMDRNSPFALPERSALPESHSESGRGLFLIRALMDSVEHSSKKEGNILRLRKRLFGA